MSIGNTITNYRKQLGLTQEALAQRLGVTNQAVSKWELDQSCPDIQLLPTLADLFGVSIDAFFGRTPAASAPQLPWEDDDTLRVVVYLGHKRMADYKPHSNGNLYGNLSFHLQGDAKNVQSELSLTVEGNVLGNATSGGSLTCGDITGEVRANGSVNCDSVEGNVSAGGSVNCDSIAGSVKAGGSVTCDEIGGDVTAGGSVTCDHISGSCTQQ